MKSTATLLHSWLTVSRHSLIWHLEQVEGLSPDDAQKKADEIINTVKPA